MKTSPDLDLGDGVRSYLGMSTARPVFDRLASELGLDHEHADELLAFSLEEIQDLGVQLSCAEANLEEAEQEIEDFVSPSARLIDEAGEIIHEMHNGLVFVDLRNCQHPACRRFHDLARKL